MGFQFALAIEIVLDRALGAAADEDDVFDNLISGLVDDIAKYRTINYVVQFLGRGFGSGQDARAQPGVALDVLYLTNASGTAVFARPIFSPDARDKRYLDAPIVAVRTAKFAAISNSTPARPKRPFGFHQHCGPHDAAADRPSSSKPLKAAPTFFTWQVGPPKA